jgi:hypothetical protein
LAKTADCIAIRASPAALRCSTRCSFARQAASSLRSRRDVSGGERAFTEPPPVGVGVVTQPLEALEAAAAVTAAAVATRSLPNAAPANAEASSKREHDGDVAADRCFAAAAPAFVCTLPRFFVRVARLLSRTRSFGFGFDRCVDAALRNFARNMASFGCSHALSPETKLK